MAAGAPPAAPQPADGVTYAAKLTREEARLDWRRAGRSTSSARCAPCPRPGAWFEIAGERIKVLRRAERGRRAARRPAHVHRRPADDRLRRGRAAPAEAAAAGKAAAAGRRISCAASACRRARSLAVTRFRLTLEYDGGRFVGWQRQENGPSVQQALEEAVFAFCGERTASVAAGRTDAGVHALGQVVHLDLAKDCSAETLRDAVNFHLKPQPVAVLAAEVARPDFHARFSATGRRYLYRIVNRRAPLALERGRAWRVSRAARRRGDAGRGPASGRAP